VDLKVQSKHRDKNCPVRMYTKLFEVKNGKIETIFGFLDALNRDKIWKIWWKNMLEYELQN
jgi:hypothetical protein